LKVPAPDNVLIGICYHDIDSLLSGLVKDLYIVSFTALVTVDIQCLWSKMSEYKVHAIEVITVGMSDDGLINSPDSLLPQVRSNDAFPDIKTAAPGAASIKNDP